MKFFCIFLLVFLHVLPLSAEKIKQLANVVGVRDNQLIGYGIVVGLNGTGDGSSSKFTLQSLSNLLQTVNVKINPDDIKSKNIAAVFVTAQLPPFSRQGDKLNAVISSIGDAKSLEGGTLLMTPLKGVDGDIYALAQGTVSIGGMNGTSRTNINHDTSGSIMSGAIVEKEVLYDIYSQQNINLSLNDSDFQTALLIQNKINQSFKNKLAVAVDSRTIQIAKPQNLSMIEFLAKALELDVKYEMEDKIVIDERTGTVVAGINVHVKPVVITHGQLTLKIQPQNNENTFEENENNILLDDEVSINQNANTINIDEEQITVANITRALNKLGATPKDIISILENIKRAGAIRAKLEIM